jgi:outer membrane protein assembly factor BamB
MPLSSKLSHRIFISVTCLFICISCSKTQDHSRTPTSIQSQYSLQPFSAQIVFLQPNQAIVSWSASKDSVNDVIKYKVLLGGKTIDSNLTRLSDTLNNMVRGFSYEGSVIAYNPHNNTISASYRLDITSTGYVYFYLTQLGTGGQTVQCEDVYTNQRVWTFDPKFLLGGFQGTPVVVNDTLYANYDISFVFALNAKTGSVIWKSPQLTFTSQYDNNFEAPYQNGPIYSDGKVYINTGNSITCLNSATGQILWGDQDGTDYYTTPVVDNGKVFVGTLNDHYGSSGIPDTFAFKALDGNTGATIWKQVNGIQSVGSPIACNGFVLYNSYSNTSNDQCVALDEMTGTQVWATTSGNFLNYDPVHYDNLMICWTSNPQNQLEALDVSTGHVVWQTPPGIGGTSDPFVSHDTVFFSQSVATTTPSAQFQLVAVSAKTGAVLWSNLTTPSYLAYLCVAGDRIYMQAPDNQSLNVYSTKDGSYIGKVNATGGAIQLNGVSYYSAISGMEQ